MSRRGKGTDTIRKSGLEWQFGMFSMFSLPWLWFIDEQNTCPVWSARCRDEGGHLNVLDSNSRALV